VIVVAIYVALVGTIVGMVWWAARGIGEGIGAAVNDAFGDAFDDLIPFLPWERTPDLEIAPGALGYVESLGTAGPQLHFYSKERDRTRVAAVVWVRGGRARLPVADYDGPPSREWGPRSARPRRALLPLLVVRVVDAEGRPRQRAGVWWTRAEEVRAIGPALCDAGEVNLVLLPGVVTLWADAGPRAEILLADHEIVRCTLGPKGLVVEDRETRR
jgi:hypothetical protein